MKEESRAINVRLGSGRLAEWHEVPAGGTVVVEGSYSTSKPLRDYYSTAIWVQAAYETRLRRGSSAMASPCGRLGKVWMPAEDRYLQAERPDLHADIVWMEGESMTQSRHSWLSERPVACNDTDG